MSYDHKHTEIDDDQNIVIADIEPQCKPQREFVNLEPEREPQHELRDKRQLTMPFRYENYIMVMRKPCSSNEAIHSEDQQHWVKAMDEEIVSLSANGTWDLVGKPTDKNVIDNC